MRATTRYIACWCNEWLEDREPNYSYRACETPSEAMRVAALNAESSDYPDFAEVYEEQRGRYGWDRLMTYYLSNNEWLQRHDQTED